MNKTIMNHTNFSGKGGTYMKKLLILLLAIGMVMTGCTNASDSDSPDANETGGNSGGDSDGSSSTS
jgi:hypothetical protein